MGSGLKLKIPKVLEAADRSGCYPFTNKADAMTLRGNQSPTIPTVALRIWYEKI